MPANFIVLNMIARPIAPNKKQYLNIDEQIQVSFIYSTYLQRQIIVDDESTFIFFQCEDCTDMAELELPGDFRFTVRNIKLEEIIGRV